MFSLTIHAAHGRLFFWETEFQTARHSVTQVPWGIQVALDAHFFWLLGAWGQLTSRLVLFKLVSIDSPPEVLLKMQILISEVWGSLKSLHF